MTPTAPRRWTALVVATSLLMPALAGCGSKGGDTTPAPTGTMAPQTAPMAQNAPTANPGLSTKQKVVLLAGAALLYYIYKKDQANNAAAAAGSAKPQLYQSKNGGIYYRDAQHRPVWVTAPSQPVAVPADQVQHYLPNYQQYQGQPAPPAPAGYATQPATQFDPSLTNTSYPTGPSGPSGPPGPRG